MITDILGALVHDIGKVGQRAGLSGRHPEIGSAMLRGVLPANIEEIAGLVSKHHDAECRSSPGFEPLKIVMLSDWMSAGERTPDDRAEDPLSPLVPIFSNVSIGKGIPEEGRGLCYPISPLMLGAEIFPRERDRTVEVKESYRHLWEELRRDLQRIQKIRDPDAYLITLLYLMKKYTLLIPSAAYGSVPDISLYDHSRIAAAVAACMRYEELDEILREVESGDKPEPRFILVNGDISGIQRFLYTVTSKGALKGLRGRSFYIQLLSETVAKFILRELGYPLTNLIYSGGGHFYLLLRSSEEDRLKDIQRRIERAMLDMHRGDLFLVLGWSRLSVSDLMGDRKHASASGSNPTGVSVHPVSRKWGEAGEMVARAKLRKFSEIAPDSYDTIFGPFPDETGGTARVCDVCGREADLWIRTDQGWERFSPDDASTDLTKICSHCRRFEEMGEELPRAEYLVESRALLKGSPHLLCSFEHLGTHYYSCRRSELKGLIESLGRSNSVIYSLSTGFIDETLVSIASEHSAALGFRLIARAAPMDNGRILDNTEIAGSSEGINRLGILRMDVDDLGLVFSRGLADATLSRISTLSTMLSVFFDGWVDGICRNTGRTYLIYSGGDDLFIIGSWDVIPEVALRIREDFRRYTCHNPNLTISAGISIVDDMFPLYKSADLAKEELETAKGLERDGKQKDAVCFLGETMDWTEFRISRGIALSLSSWIKDGRNGERLPRSVLGIIYGTHEIYRRNREMLRRRRIPLEDLKRLAMYDRWRWLMVYYLDRLGERSHAFRDDLKGLVRSILESSWGDIRSPREIIEYLAVPARWAEMLTREGGE
ncbi:MAG: type III-A CRISPR-associated protein Cas10/Csm1 [Methanothrix sp.]|nr:type III-A CRISPR-associated protein Cas10/Csm1 [Methanothrix sp.]MCX8207803.1 type III-A CRISPR-associated protein Cas10/Csm1 [Methanothrix sp.]